jgi:phosphatidate cytidylyltransferase
MKPANFFLRTLTAIVFLVLMAGTILLGALYFAVLMLFVYCLGMIELYKLISPEASLKAKITGLIAGLIAYLLVFLINYAWLPARAFWVFPAILFMPVIVAMFDKDVSFMRSAATSLAGIALLAVPFAVFVSLIPLGDTFESFTGSEFLLLFLLILWLYDSGAYLIGSWLGKNRLFERISPAKSWEGCMGGLLVAMAVAWSISIFYTEIHFLHWMAIALIIVVFGTLGDLSESMLKRYAGCKDSGKLLPGHGGILDRFDAVLMSAPMVYIYITFFIN